MIKKFAVLFMTAALAVGAVVPSYANTYDKNCDRAFWRSRPGGRTAVIHAELTVPEMERRM